MGWEKKMEGRRQGEGVEDSRGGDEEDNNSRGEGGGYLILASVGAERLVKLWTRQKEGLRGEKGKGGSNGPEQWKCCATLNFVVP